MISIMLETFPFPLSILYYIFSLWEEKILRFLRIQRFDAFGNVFLFKITMVFPEFSMHTVFPPSALLIPRKKERAISPAPGFLIIWHRPCRRAS